MRSKCSTSIGRHVGNLWTTSPCSPGVPFRDTRGEQLFRNTGVTSFSLPESASRRPLGITHLGHNRLPCKHRCRRHRLWGPTLGLERRCRSEVPRLRDSGRSRATPPPFSHRPLSRASREGWPSTVGPALSFPLRGLGYSGATVHRDTTPLGCQGDLCSVPRVGGVMGGCAPAGRGRDAVTWRDTRTCLRARPRNRAARPHRGSS